MNFRRTAIIAILFILLGGFYLIYERRIKPKQKQQEIKESQVFGTDLIDLEKVESITIIRHQEPVKGVVSFVLDEGTWRMTEPKDSIADDRIIHGIAQSLVSLKKEQILRETPTEEDLIKFGLLEPAFQVAFKVAGTEHRILLGDVTVDGRSFYAKLPDKPQLFMAPAGFKFNLERNISDYRDKQLFTAGIDQVEGLAVNNPQHTYLFTRSDEGWVIKSPPIPRPSSTEAESYIRNFLDIRVNEFYEDTPENREEFGLNETAIYGEVYLRDAGEPITIRIGKADQIKGEIYAMVKGAPELYGLRIFEEQKFKTPPSNFVRRTMVADEPEAVGTLTITLPDRVVKIARSDESADLWEMHSPVRKKLDTGPVMAVLRNSANMYAWDARFVTEDDAFYGLDSPDMVIEGTKADGENIYTITYGGKVRDEDEDLRYARVRGEDVVVIVNEPRYQDLKKMAENLMKSADASGETDH